jgi:hypothetical protein
LTTEFAFLTEALFVIIWLMITDWNHLNNHNADDEDVSIDDLNANDDVGDDDDFDDGGFDYDD